MSKLKKMQRMAMIPGRGGPRPGMLPGLPPPQPQVPGQLPTEQIPIEEAEYWRFRCTKLMQENLVLKAQKIEADKKTIQERMAQDEIVWKQEMERREILSKQIAAKLNKLYNTLKEKRQGVGVVNVRHETCQGCFVHIPPQMFIEVQKNKEIIRCPNCNRILYFEGEVKAK